MGGGGLKKPTLQPLLSAVTLSELKGGAAPTFASDFCVTALAKMGTAPTLERDFATCVQTLPLLSVQPNRTIQAMVVMAWDLPGWAKGVGWMQPFVGPSPPPHPPTPPPVFILT